MTSSLLGRLVAWHFPAHEHIRGTGRIVGVYVDRTPNRVARVLVEALTAEGGGEEVGSVVDLHVQCIRLLPEGA